MDIQAVADMEQFVDRLDKRIYDLQLSQTNCYSNSSSNSYDSKRESSIS